MNLMPLAFLFVGAGCFILGRFVEAQFWKSDCILGRVKRGKYVNYVCGWQGMSGRIFVPGHIIEPFSPRDIG